MYLHWCLIYVINKQYSQLKTRSLWISLVEPCLNASLNTIMSDAFLWAFMLWLFTLEFGWCCSLFSATARILHSTLAVMDVVSVTTDTAALSLKGSFNDGKSQQDRWSSAQVSTLDELIREHIRDNTSGNKHTAVTNSSHTPWDMYLTYFCLSSQIWQIWKNVQERFDVITSWNFLVVPCTCLFRLMCRTELFIVKFKA